MEWVSLSPVTYRIGSLLRDLGRIHDLLWMRVGLLICVVHTVSWCLSGRALSWHPTQVSCEQTWDWVSNIPPTPWRELCLQTGNCGDVELRSAGVPGCITDGEVQEIIVSDGMLVWN